MTASGQVPHPPETVFEFLSDLRNHWRLEPHFLELERMEADGGRVRVKGPLGLSRIARTAVASTERPRLLTGTAELGSRTVGRVRWEIAPAVPGTSHVTCSAEVVQASPFDRLLLAAGGRWWLTRIVRGAMQRLGAVVDA